MFSPITSIAFGTDLWITGLSVFGAVLLMGLIAWAIRSLLQPTVYIEAVDSLLTIVYSSVLLTFNFAQFRDDFSRRDR